MRRPGILFMVFMVTFGFASIGQGGQVNDGLAKMAQLRYLWPAEPGTAGGDLVELSAGAPERGIEDTPYGALQAESMPVYRSGEKVGTVTVYKVPAGAGFQAYMIETRAEEDIKGPNSSFEEPSFAAPAIRDRKSVV